MPYMSPPVISIDLERRGLIDSINSFLCSHSLIHLILQWMLWNPIFYRTWCLPLLGRETKFLPTVAGPNRREEIETVCVCVCVFSCVQLFKSSWTITCQAPLSMGSSRQEYQSGLLFPTAADLPNPDIEPESLTSPALAGGFFTTASPGKPPNRSQTYP